MKNILGDATMTIAGIQLYLGKHERELFSPQKTTELLTEFFDKNAITRLFLWNCLGSDYLEAVASACIPTGVELYLWYPALADRLSSAYEKETKIQSAWGHTGYGEKGLWKGINQGEEIFLFSCPNAEPLQERFHDEYLRLLDTGIYHGVFLDRIRYPSPSNGLEMLFSCFCPACMQAYAKAGVDPIDLREKTKNSFSNLLAIESVLKNSISWNEFLNFLGIDIIQTLKMQSIDDTFTWLAAEARKRNMHIGADLYTPALAPLVGQDYALFSAQCDWIKPMVYFYAQGPAGIQLEMRSLSIGIKGVTGWDDSTTHRFIQNITKLPMESSHNTDDDLEVPIACLHQEVSRAIALGKSNDCAVFPGIEMVRHPRFSPAITKDMLETALSYLPKEIQGIIPSWNLLYIPDEYYGIVTNSLTGGKK